MKYKMIVTDLDDTLLNSEKKISPIDLQAIMKAQETGVKFILCSGRPTFAMRDLERRLKLKNLMNIFYLSMVLLSLIVKLMKISLKPLLKKIYI